MGPAVAMRISARAETLMAQSKATLKAIFAVLITPPHKITSHPLWGRTVRQLSPELGHFAIKNPRERNLTRVSLKRMAA
jgi:hypothetical protein